MEHPTIRDTLRRKKRWALLALAVVWVGGAFFTFSDSDQTSISPYFMAIFGLAFFVGIISLGFLIRCPRCRGNIGALNAGISKTIPFYTVINYCPYCGVSLDSSAGP